MTTTKPALPEPVPPNAEGSTTCIVRWMVTTRDGLWLGAWDKEAFAAYTQAAIDAAVAEARAVPEGMVLAPHFRGYAHLGTGQYLLNHSAADEPAELVISIATDEQKAGREVGDDRGNPADAPIQPEVMAVRLRFENVAGLDALEKQLRYLRAEHFAATPSPAEQPKPAVSFQRRPARRTP